MQGQHAFGMLGLQRRGGFLRRAVFEKFDAVASPVFDYVLRTCLAELFETSARRDSDEKQSEERTVGNPEPCLRPARGIREQRRSEEVRELAVAKCSARRSLRPAIDRQISQRVHFNEPFLLCKGAECHREAGPLSQRSVRDTLSRCTRGPGNAVGKSQSPYGFWHRGGELSGLVSKVEEHIAGDFRPTSHRRRNP